MKQWLIALAVVMSACATVPSSAVYRQSPGELGQTLFILPVVNNTGDAEIVPGALDDFRTDLIREIKSGGSFAFVGERGEISPSEPGVTFLRSSISQFDTSARRMAVVTELIDGQSDGVFMRVVTHTELVSVAFPFDYVSVMARASDTIIKDLSRELSGLAGRRTTVKKNKEGD